MVEDMVMRSVYLRPTEDTQLRQLAHELNVTKSDLIRSAISAKLRDWRAPGNEELVQQDLGLGRRSSAAAPVAAVARAAKVESPKPTPARQGRTAPARSAAHRRKGETQTASVRGELAEV